MERFRGVPTQLLIAGLSIAGFAIGASLGLVTERGLPGLITVAGAILGAGVGVYIAQAISMAPSDDEQ